jgi:purine-binding chemotaxis protein CheW
MTEKKKKLQNSLKSLFTPKKSGLPQPESEMPLPHPLEQEDLTVLPQTVLPSAQPEIKVDSDKQEKAPITKDERKEPGLSWPVEAVIQPETPAAPVTTSQSETMIVESSPENTLAVVPTEIEEKSRQVLIFKLLDTSYGLDVSRVRTIIKPQPVYPIPGTEEFLKGLINLRGEVVPVFDLRTRFGLEEKPKDNNTRFIVVELGEYLAGVIVDAVEGVETIPGGAIEKPAELVTGIDTRYLHRIAHFEENLVLILDIEETLKRSDHTTVTEFGMTLAH